MRKRTKSTGEHKASTRKLIPGRRRKKGKHKIRLTQHKVRSRWFQARSAWPMREAPVQTLIRERNRAARSLASDTAIKSSWKCVGPTNIGGRITSLACHPVNADRIWVGSAGGGVWHSRNGGQTWAWCWNDQDILTSGSLAYDQQNPDTIYVGTGEANLSADSYAGVGIYRSRDAGETWQLLAAAEHGLVPKRIGVIAIDPFDHKHLLIGGVGLAETSATGKDFGGMFVSFDGGITWQRQTFISTQNYWCHAIVFHPKIKGTVYATFTEQGSRSGIWRSTDRGETWQHLTKGLPSAAQFGRTSLALSPSAPEVLYAFAKNESSGDNDLLLGVFRSSDGGDSWTAIHGKHF